MKSSLDFPLSLPSNPDAAFGVMAHWGSWLRFSVLVVASIVALGLYCLLYFSVLSNNKVADIALPLIAGGALASLYERITAGAVVDSDIYVSIYHWPAFNRSDASIMSV